MSRYISAATPLIEPFIAYRKASERWNDVSYGRSLVGFDRFCAKNYPGAETLTQEMVDGWCSRRESECNNSCASRIYAIVSMIRYAQTRELTTVNPPSVPKHTPKSYIPHAFAEIELANFFAACDDLPSSPRKTEVVSRKITVPVFFRLLYSSGIRTT